jgi:hypothetical protein
MLQVGRKQQQYAIANPYHNLIGILGRKFSDQPFQGDILSFKSLAVET